MKVKVLKQKGNDVNIVQIVHNPKKVLQPDFKNFGRFLQIFPTEAAKILSCEESGYLKAEDIAIEVTEFGPYDLNCKDLHVRVLAYDYPSRRGNNLIELDILRYRISGCVWPYFPLISWAVWVQLAPTSFLSDDIMRAGAEKIPDYVP